MKGGRADKLKRLLRVQRQVEGMAENDLALSLRELARIDDERKVLIRATGSSNPVHQVMAPFYTRRFTGLEAKSQRLGEIRRMLEQRVLKERAKTEKIEDSARNQAELEERQADDEKLFDLIDTVLAMRSDSSPA